MRNRKVFVDGRETKVIRFLEERAKSLPVLTLKGGEEKVDHVLNVRKIYMTKGVDGVNQYLKAVQAISMRDTGKWYIRIAGILKLMWLKIKN